MTNQQTVLDKRAPMPSAPMKYKTDGSVDWGNMWDSFCVLAQEGGPPHRKTLLDAPAQPHSKSVLYQQVVAELVRGIWEVSGLMAQPHTPGWLAITCPDQGMAGWLAEAIQTENVVARAEGTQLLVPVGAEFTVKGEIKNVITAVAKTTHYWKEHLPPAVKTTLAWQARFGWLKQQFSGRR
ncbi:MAG: hypothetical protein AAF614_34195 [Chloroflexota bacterium]